MPANPRDNQVVETVGPNDLIPVSLRGSSDRANKTEGYIDRTWYIKVSDLASVVDTTLVQEDIANALLEDATFLATIAADAGFVAVLAADPGFVAALLAALDGEVEPTWDTE